MDLFFEMTIVINSAMNKYENGEFSIGVTSPGSDISKLKSFRAFNLTNVVRSKTCFMKTAKTLFI